MIVSYTVEILPFSVRAKGFNIFNLTISIALIFNQYVNPIALGHLSWRYYVSYKNNNPFLYLHAFLQIVYVCWIVFETAFCYVYIVETKNRSLEETAAMFDGVGVDELLARPSEGKELPEDSEKGASDTNLHIEHLGQQA